MTDYGKLLKAELVTLCGERGLVLTGTKSSLVARLVESDSEPVEADAPPEVTHEEFIETAYQEILKRAADPDGLRHYTQLLMLGNSREWVVDDLASSDEAKSLGAE